MANKNKIVYGGRVFEGNKIKSGNLHIATSLLSSSLEANTLSVVIETDGQTITEFERNAPIVYFYDDVQAGVFYVKSIDRNGPNTYKISATSVMGLLSEKQHYGGIYSGETASELLASICGTIPYEIKTNLADIKLYGWLPIATARDNLSQVLFAIGATIRTDLDGVLRIASLWDGISGDLGMDRMYQGPSVTNAAKVTQVIVTEHQYIKSGESSTLFEGDAEAGGIVTFDDPVFNLSASGFTILESGANYAKLSSGSGKLTGTKYTHNKRQIIRNIVSAKETNVKKVENATLVSLINSAAVAARMENYYKHAQSIQAKVVYKGESTGNRVLTWDPYNKEPVTACIETEDINISNTLKSSLKMLVGYKPHKADVGTLDQRVVLTGAGEWVVPDEVLPGTIALVVLIGGGSGGWSGLPGDPGGEQSIVSDEQIVTNYMTFYKDVSIALGGAGGKPGEPGAGGKILQVNMTIDPGQRFSYSCGKGGKGGAAGEETVQGEEGGDTEFGTYSSASGSRSPDGYMDVTTQEIFAADGVSGVAGGSGMGFQDGAVVPGSDVVYNGVTYKCGQRNTDPNREQSAGDVGNDYGFRTASSSGGFGGGAAAGANGADGGPPASAYVSSTSATAYGGKGANGADAVAPEKPSTYGTGGTGGNGGGGGGIGGSGYTSCRIRTGAWGEPKYEVATLNSYAAERSVGGKASPGADGGDGCVLVFFGAPKTYVSGPVKDKNEKMVLDRLGRRIIV